MGKLDYIERTERDLRRYFSNKKSFCKKNNIDVLFDSKSFVQWYFSIDKKCNYCNLKEIEQFTIINNGLLKSKRFFVEKNGNRGKYLEVDRKDPNGPYSIKNCVLSCYFCNNDKSDVFDESQYGDLNGNNKSNHRVNFLRSLLNE
jgi:hypothetical protein